MLNKPRFETDGVIKFTYLGILPFTSYVLHQKMEVKY